MPRNKKEGIIFGVTMCFLMVCGMSAYNLALVGKLNFAKFAVGLIPDLLLLFSLIQLSLDLLQRRLLSNCQLTKIVNYRLF